MWPLLSAIVCESSTLDQSSGVELCFDKMRQTTISREMSCSFSFPRCPDALKLSGNSEIPVTFHFYVHCLVPFFHTKEF